MNVLCATCGSGRYCWLHDENRDQQQPVIRLPRCAVCGMEHTAPVHYDATLERGGDR